MKKETSAPIDPHPGKEKIPRFQIGNTIFNAGDNIGVEGKRRNFKFQAVVTNLETGVQWLDLVDPKTQAFSACYLHQAKLPKRVKTVRKREEHG